MCILYRFAVGCTALQIRPQQYRFQPPALLSCICSASLLLSPSAMSGAKDLLEFIDWSCLECLNEQHAHPATNVLKQGYREDDGLFLESDTDEQLLLNIHFNQKVRIHSITIKGPEEEGPKLVKLYTNRMSLGFSDADSMPCAQQLDLTPKDLAGEPVSLKLTKFNSVTILSILIDSNQSDADTTKVFKISFAGQAGDTFNVAEIKKQEEQG